MFRYNFITGLDIGINSIKAVIFKKTSTGWRLADTVIEPIPLENQQNQEDKLPYINGLKRIVENRPWIKHSYLITAIPRNVAIIKYLQLPSLDKKEIQNMLPFEVEKTIPLSMDKVIFDYQVIDVDELNKAQSEIMVVVVKKDIVEEHLELLAEAGLKAEIIDITSLALQRAFVHNFPGEKETIVLVDVGARTTEISILHEGLLKFTRSAPIGGLTLNQMLHKEFGLSLAEAEKVKIEGKAFTIEKFRETGEAWGRLLRTEITQSLEAFRTDRQKKKIAKVYLTGGGSKLVGLSDYLERKLDLPVKSFDPFPLWREAADEFSQEQSPFFPAAMGLAIRGFKKSKIDIDLRPEAIKVAKARLKKKKLMAIAGLVIIVLLAYFGVRGYIDINEKQKEIMTIDQELESMKKDLALARDLQTKVEMVKGRTANTEMALDVLRQLHTIAPSNIYVDHLVVEGQDRVVMHGKTESHSAAATFCIALERSHYFDRVINKGSREVVFGNLKLVEFDIECILKRS